MKKCLFFTLVIASILTLAGCKNSTDASGDVSENCLSKPEFPLDEDTVKETLDELGLNWVISEEETSVISKENAEGIMYTLRDPEKMLDEESKDNIFYAGISSGFYKGKRQLSMVFDSKSHSLDKKPFAWEDWKEEIILSTILYGGFEDKEEVYHALSELEIPSGDNVLKMGVQLSNGYCVAQRGAVDKQYSPGNYTLWMNFYESEKAYQEAEKDNREAWKKAQEDKRKRREEYLKKMEEAGTPVSKEDQEAWEKAQEEIEKNYEESLKENGKED